MAGIGGYNGWRWIFIIEGLLTVAMGAISKFFIPDWPHEAKFLSSSEKALLHRRLEEEWGEARMDHWDRETAWRIAKDWKMYVG